MRIVLLPIPDGDVIAREEQLGRFEGDFVVASDGHVFYRHYSDTRLWLAGRSVAAFQEVATAWNQYCDEARECQSEADGAKAAAKLRECISRLSMLQEHPHNFWTSLLEQAESGLL